MTILVVGGGKMGLSHFAISSRIVGWGKVAVCDSNRIHRYILNRIGVRTFSHIDDALQALGQDLQGGIIATPTGSHFAIAQKFLQRSIPCFIEKPLTLKPADSEALLRMAEQSGTYVQMGFVLRYLTSFTRMRELVQSGKLGRCLGYTARMNGNVVTKPNNRSWRTNYAAGGGCLNEYGPHLIDLCRFLFGDVERVDQASKAHVHSTQADDRIAFTWHHRSGGQGAGVKGDVSLDWCDPSKRKSVSEFTIRFEHGEVFGDTAALHYTFSPSCPLSEAERLALNTPIMPPRVSFYLRGEEFSLQMEDFLSQCLGRNLRADEVFGLGNHATLSDGLAVDRLIYDIAGKAGLQ